MASMNRNPEYVVDAISFHFELLSLEHDRVAGLVGSHFPKDGQFPKYR